MPVGEGMNKEQFLIALRKEGFICTTKNGVPTVIAKDKDTLSKVKKFARSISYNYSYGVSFNGANVLSSGEPETAGYDKFSDEEPQDDIQEAAGSIEEPVNEEIRPNVDDTDLPGESNDDDISLKQAETTEPQDEKALFYAQPSIFDMFDGFD